jgi:hypothetical protein
VDSSMMVLTFFSRALICSSGKGSLGFSVAPPEPFYVKVISSHIPPHF